MSEGIFSQKNIYVFSIKYAPGLLKEIITLSANLKSNNIRLFISERYKYIAQEYQNEEFFAV